MKQSRRRFLRDSACGLSGAALVSSLNKLNLVNAMVQQQREVAADYRALVCIFLYGGTDGNNMIVPLDSEYNAYSSVRSAAGLALPQSVLLPINPASGRQFGLHPNLSPEVANPGQSKGLLDVWNQGKLAVLCNVGSLIQPITRAQYQANIGHPYQLFSHSDQQTQQQTIVSDTVGQTGWGGRVADVAGALNGNVPLPMNVSVAGTSLFATGKVARQLAIAPAPTPLNNVLAINWSGPSSANPGNENSSYRQLLGIDLDSFPVKTASDTTNQALVARAALLTDPAVGTFPATQLGNQLKQIAKLIKIKDTLGMKRQIFFCSLGGFDTHTNQTGSNPASPNNGGANSGAQGYLLAQLSQAMKALYDELGAQGVLNNVTAFTLSDFGRTLQASGSGPASVGTDHAWGGHALIMGGAVLGGTFYGTYPTLALNGPNDTDNRGRWIPTTSIDQYAATLATWYGLIPSDLATAFPHLSRFSPSNLGFLG